MGCNALEMLESGKCKTTMYGLYIYMYMYTYILTIKGDIVHNDLILLGYDGT